MKKALASAIVVVFAGLVCTSLFTVFTQPSYGQSHEIAHEQFPYILTY